MVIFVIPASNIQGIIDRHPLLKKGAMVAFDDPSGLLLPSGSAENRSWIFSSAYRSQHVLDGVQQWEKPNAGEGEKDAALQQVLDKIAAASSSSLEANLNNSSAAAIPLQAMLQYATRTMNFNLFQTAPCYDEWFDKRVVLVGDAIHATTPLSGEGRE